MFLGEVTCTGSEGNLSECGNVLSSDNCARAAISCWKYSRELLNNQQLLSSNYVCATLNKTGEVRCANQIHSATITANQGYKYNMGMNYILSNLSVFFANIFLVMEYVLSMNQKLTYAMGY